MAKDYENRDTDEDYGGRDKDSIFEELLKFYEEDEPSEEVGDPVPGDPINVIRQRVESGSSGGGGGILGKILPIAARIGIGYLTGGASSAAGTGIPMFIPAADGGQIKKKTTTKKKKRVVRGVGAAKRGYGKATYSNKMY